jgi:hypothetical protein
MARMLDQGDAAKRAKPAGHVFRPMVESRPQVLFTTSFCGMTAGRGSGVAVAVSVVVVVVVAPAAIEVSVEVELLVVLVTASRGGSVLAGAMACTVAVTVGLAATTTGLAATVAAAVEVPLWAAATAV